MPINSLLFDARWIDLHGIGRTASELALRLFSADAPPPSPKWPASPVSPADPFARGAQLLASPRSLFYSPGFNAPAAGRARCVFTVHDLIHLRVAGEAGVLKRAYYERLVKPAVRQSFKVLTVSEYSRSDVLDWSGADPAQVVNVGSGVDAMFFAPATPHDPGFPYLLYVGARKPHKNLDRLLAAFAASKASAQLRLVVTGAADAMFEARIAALGLSGRVHYAGRIPDAALPGWYQGATALLFPSLFEGFGLPPVEAMAGGTPALVANTTSLPEAVGDAAVLVEAESVESIHDGIDRIVFDSALRARLREAGPAQARRHSWDAVAARVRSVLDALQGSVQP